MKKLIALPLILSLLLVCGCDGGSIYSNYREIEQLTVIQTLGLDITENGIRASVATGTAVTEKPVRMTAEAESIELALQRIADYSVSEEMFFAHTAYVLIGEETARQDMHLVLDYIERSDDMRLDMPIFIVKGGAASELVLGAGDEEGSKSADYDITEVLRSIERSVESSGDGLVLTAAQVISALDERGSSLVSVIEVRKADEALDGAKEALTALPAGFAVIKDGKKVGDIVPEDASAVSVIMGKSGPARIALDVGTPVTVQLSEGSAEVMPIFKNGALSEIWMDVTISANVTEAEGQPSESEIKAALKAKYEDSFSEILMLSKRLDTDFLGLGAMLERREPQHLCGMSTSLGGQLNGLTVIVNVSVEIIMPHTQ